MTKVVTANRLSDGAVVYVGADGWVETLSAAARLTDPTGIEAALVEARADEARNAVVDVFVADVVEDGATLRPVSLRDRIRAEGPSISYGLPALTEGK